MAPKKKKRRSKVVEIGTGPTRVRIYGYRYYHPNLGRWTSRDPIEEHSFFTFFTAAMTARGKSR